MFRLVRHHVLIPDDEWTAFSNEIPDKCFKRLKEKNAAAVFVVLYDLAYHSRNSAVKASLSDLSQRTGLDTRVVKQCLAKLLELKLIRKSKSHKRTWKVPLAKLDLEKGTWTPAPRLVFRHYIPVYQNAVLLLSILRIQSWRRL